MTRRGAQPRADDPARKGTTRIDHTVHRGNQPEDRELDRPELQARCRRSRARGGSAQLMVSKSLAPKKGTYSARLRPVLDLVAQELIRQSANIT